MGRAPSSSNHNEGMNKGAWTAEEDALLIEYIKEHGEGRWGRIAKQAGIKRCGKSCRLRWLNYLRPDIKRGNITQDEEDLIIRLHRLLGNRWSLIAGRLPGRTDNEIKNYWNSTLGKRAQARPKPNPSPAAESAQPANLPENRDAVAPPQPMPKPPRAFRTEPDSVVGAPEQDDRYGDGGAWASLNSLHEDSGARKWAAGDDDGDSFSSGGSFAEGCLRWKVGDHTVSDSEFWDMLGDWMADDGYGSELA